ncbi:MAG: sn-glycerol-1-phosphate dehydrogenase [Halanaerobiaceae bacterium]
MNNEENNIKEIIIKEKANLELPGLLSKLADMNKIYLIADENTFDAAGEDIYKLLNEENYQVKNLVLQGEKIVADTDYLFKVFNNVSRDGYFLACGSGTINDLTRYVSYKLEQPYLVAATAPSMDGYASPVSPITVDGVKATYNAVIPEAVVADTEVLKDAPWKMIQAGFGDLLGKISALMDWKLSNIIFGEDLIGEAISLVERELLRLISNRSGLKERAVESIGTLTRGLINSGIAMQITGSSRPASGTEHHISHFLEMYGEIYEQDLPPHGVKVALGEYFAAQMYLKLYETDFSKFKNSDDYETRKQRIKENYLSRSEPVLATLKERWPNHQLDINILQEKEEDIKKLIQENFKYLNNMNNYLDEMGIFSRKDVKSIDKEWLINAVQSAFEIRNRYTVANLLYQIGLLEEWSYEMVDKFKKNVNS